MIVESPMIFKPSPIPRRAFSRASGRILRRRDRDRPCFLEGDGSIFGSDASVAGAKASTFFESTSAS